MKKNLPTITPILYTSKILANGEHPIMLRVCYNGKRSYKSMGISCKTTEWSKDKNKVKGSRANNLNVIITNEAAKANSYIFSIEGKEDYSANSIVKYLTKKTPTQTTLYSLFEERISFFKKDKQSHNNATGYRTLLNIIKRYTNYTDAELFEISLSWLVNFEEYLHCHYADNSIRKFFDCFKAIMNYAIRQNYISQSPFLNFEFKKKLETNTPKRALSLNEIDKLLQYYYQRYGYAGKENNNVYGERNEKQYWVNQRFKARGQNKITPINSEQFALALYLTSYFMQGLALVDIANLKIKDMKLLDIVDKEQYLKDSANHNIDYADYNKQIVRYYDISIYRKKTHHPTRIIVECLTLLPFLNPFDSYFDNYDEIEEEEKERYVFPIFNHTDDSPEVKFKRMTYMNYLVNLNLKRIAKRLGMPPITFYSARHSYASQLYHANVPMGLIAQNMGRNPNDIETYLKNFDALNIIDANKKSLTIGQDTYQETRKNKLTNKEQREVFQDKEEENRILKDLGFRSIKEYDEHIKDKLEELRKNLTERFGDDINAKIEYLKKNIKIDDK